MRIGAVRPEEACVFDSHAGFHSFHSEPSAHGRPAHISPGDWAEMLAETADDRAHGSFEVFFLDARGAQQMAQDLGDDFGEGVEALYPGWYWQAGFPGCLPDGEPCGPFASSQQAHEDADEWAPEYDEEASA